MQRDSLSGKLYINCLGYSSNQLCPSKNGVTETDGSVTKAADFLLERQHTKIADWSVKNPNSVPGGWGFSNINTNNPDCDDTAAVLKAIPRNHSPAAWERGVSWLLSMQNNDGGFSAFEKT